MAVLRKHRNFYKTTFHKDNRDDDHIDRTDVTIGLADVGDTNNGTLKKAVSTKYTFILPAQCVKCQTSYFSREARAQAARKPGRRPIPFLFVIGVTMYQFLPNRRSRCYLQLVVRFVR